MTICDIDPSVIKYIMVGDSKCNPLSQKQTIDVDKADPVWWVFNSHFKWRKANDMDVSTINEETRLKATNHPGKIYNFKPGHRRFSQHSESLDVEYQRIPNQFQVRKHNELKGYCVWLSVCLLVSMEDNPTGTHMLLDMKRNQQNYRHLNLFPSKTQGGRI